MSAQIAFRVINAAVAATVITQAWLTLSDTVCAAWLEAPLQPDGFKVNEAVGLEVAQTLLNEWPEGRLFGPLGELRWETCEDKQIHLVLVSEAQLLPSGYSSVLPLAWQEDTYLYLWGHADRGHQWSETRIPSLNYPPTWHGPNAAIATRVYEHLADMTRPYDSRIVRYLSYDGNIPD